MVIAYQFDFNMISKSFFVILALVLSHVSGQNDDFYDGCGSTKMCAAPEDDACIVDKNCSIALASWAISSVRYQFEIMASITPETGYVAAGLSPNSRASMDSLNVMACLIQENMVKQWRTADSGAHELQDIADPFMGISDVSISVVDDVVRCSFVKDSYVNINNEYFNAAFDLNHKEFSHSFAQGLTDGNGGILQHDTYFTSSIKKDYTLVNPFLWNFYNECDGVKQCVGVPEGCIQGQSCDMALSYYGIEESKYMVQVMGKLDLTGGWKYIAAGLSPNDVLMGDDSVMACINRETEAKFEAQNYWIGDNRDVVLMNSTIRIRTSSFNYDSGVFQCIMYREGQLDMALGGGQGVFDVNQNAYQLIFAKGNVNQTDKTILKHDDKYSVDQDIVFGNNNPYRIAVYQGCDVDKGCVGFPEGCVANKACSMFMSYKGISADQYQIQMLGTDQAYVAVTFSPDQGRGSDVMVACSSGTPEQSKITIYYNEDDQISLPTDAPGLSNPTIDKVKNNLICNVILDASLSVTNPNNNSAVVSVQLNTQDYFVLLSKGSVSDQGVIQEEVEAEATAEAISLVDYNNFYGNNDYDGCGETQGCFGLGSDTCVDDYDCSVLMTYTMNADASVNFKIVSKSILAGQYAAIALSRDDKMGDDLVMTCYLDSNEVVGFAMSWNLGSVRENEPFTDRPGVEQDPVLGYEDGSVSCAFTLAKDVVITVPNSVEQQSSFDLEVDQYYLLVASGALNETSSPISLVQHGQRTSSASATNLGDTGRLKAGKDIEVKLHGCFMVFAWLFLGSCGVFTARYGKKQFGGKQVMGKDVWFPLHQGLMLCTVLLSVAAFIIILVEKGFDPLTSKAIETNPHSLLGLITFCLMFIQPFMALMRCHPGTKYRPVFNWAHRLVGFSAMVLANTAIYLTTIGSFSALKLDPVAEYIVIAKMCFFALWHLSLTVYTCTKKEDNLSDDAMIRFGMVTFFIGAFGLSVALMVFICMA